MSVLLTGANGFLGKQVYQALREQGTAVVSSSKTGQGADIKLDVSCADDFSQNIPASVTSIINCASALPYASGDSRQRLDTFYRCNVLGALNVCEFAATRPNLNTIVHCSSLSVVAKPWDKQLTESDATYPAGNHVLYAGSKLMQELLFESHRMSHDFELTSLRFSSLYGPQMKERGILQRMVEQGINEGQITIHNADTVFFDFLHVRDAADIVIETLNAKKGYGVVNAALGKEISVRDLAQMIASELNVTVIDETVGDQPAFVSRSDISIAKLDEYMDTSSFTNPDKGIKELIADVIDSNR